MNGLKKIVYVLFLIATGASAQIKKVQFVSDHNQLPLSNVEVYDGNLLIGKTDRNGFVEVNTGDSDYLHTIKEDYKDSLIKVSDLQEKVTLYKNKPIELEEMVIGRKGNASVRKILNRIQENFEDLLVSTNKLPRYYNVTSKLLMEK